MTEHAFKQSAVDGEPLGRRELEGFFPQQLCDSGRDNIRFFGFVLYFGAGGTLLIIAMDALLGFINGDFALDVILGRIQQIGRGIQPVHRLQADGSLPRLAFFGSVRFTLLDIFFQFKLPILIRHICTSFLAQIFRLEGRVPFVIVAVVDALPMP